MKTFITIASCFALTALAACTEAPVEERTGDSLAEKVAVPAVPKPGEYSLAYGDGTTGRLILGADGTYSATNPEGLEVSGTHTQVDGKTCFTPEGAEEANCWTNSAKNDENSYFSTSDDGNTVTVSPVTVPAE